MAFWSSKRLRAIEAHFGQIQPRLGRCELGALLARVERHQHLALRDMGSRGERDLRYDSRLVRAERDALHRGKRLPTASSELDHSACCATTVVTASGGGWYPLFPAIAAEIWRYLTKPSIAR